jgi:putative spermidine/putrescine transport system permease protein
MTPTRTASPSRPPPSRAREGTGELDSAGPARGRLPDWAAALLLLAPALLLLAALFLYPLVLSLVSAFTDRGGGLGLDNFRRVFELYSRDVIFTGIVAIAVVVICDVLAIAIGGYLILGRNPTAVAILRWLYRWPLFIPFVVAAQMMRSFLAKNGLMNNSLVAMGVLEPASTIGLLDWRGMVITFVWKQLPFVTLIVAGAMASLDRSMIEAARNLGASRTRALVEIVIPQIRAPLVVASVLTFVTLLSVLSVPMMINAGSPTMITVDMAYRITSLSDYGAANALGVISYLMTAAVAWLYLRQGVARRLDE